MRRFIMGMVAALLLTTGAQAAQPVIEISGPIREELVEPLAAAMVISLNANPKFIVIEINSGGGSVDAGLKMAMLIERSPAPVYCIVDNEAQSMAFYLLQSCNVRIVTKRSHLMTHEPSTSFTGGGGGDRHFFQACIDHLNMLNKLLAEHIAPRLGMSVSEYIARIDRGEWSLGWEEALQHHATDYVVEDFYHALEKVATLAQ